MLATMIAPFRVGHSGAMLSPLRREHGGYAHIHAYPAAPRKHGTPLLLLFLSLRLGGFA
jgi:hypothetical protein